ncbi:hypothetical protein GJ654_12365 [Rhodoblastus acidophilus]|uniref:AcrB/AcrD/AcrF family protein n=1 Tax=Rhodoblastus acidophilus TaxID=1074 RepID=A0A6N8DSG9_RHOAC|nr:hypothetical protein [Rhodoblastus acidophilus]
MSRGYDALVFVRGAPPLILATGAGAELRQALGTAVFFGMLGATVFGLIFTPTSYVLRRTRRGGPWPERQPEPPAKSL